MTRSHDAALGVRVSDLDPSQVEDVRGSRIGGRGLVVVGTDDLC